MKRRSTLRSIAAVGTIAATVPIVHAAPASAAHTTHLMLLNSNNDGSGDLFSNYDLTFAGYNQNGVDWGISFVFYGYAEIDKVKIGLRAGDPGLRYDGSTMYEYLRDNGYMDWDRDNGIKNAQGSCPSDVHMRLYADSGDDQMGWSSSWGFWIVASDHKDIRETCSNQEFGYSEDAEAVFAGYAVSAGWWTNEDSLTMYNNQTVDEGNHIWDQNGLGTASYVP